MRQSGRLDGAFSHQLGRVMERAGDGVGSGYRPPLLAVGGEVVRDQQVVTGEVSHHEGLSASAARQVEIGPCGHMWGDTHICTYALQTNTHTYILYIHMHTHIMYTHTCT